MTRTMNRLVLSLAIAAFVAGLCIGAPAAEEKGGWQMLFNGKDFSGWQNAGGQRPGKGWVVEDGAMARTSGAGDIWTRGRYGDFVLDLEFKTEGNSGIFIRTGNPKDNVQTGIEIQVDRPAKLPSKHSCGAVYDAQAPSKEASKKGEWNHVVITARGSHLLVAMNDQPIIDIALDRWTEPGKNPDGTKNKYRKAIKDFPREGHIGLQDHGANVCYRNIKLKPLGEK